MIPHWLRDWADRKFNPWRYEEPEKLGKELAEEHLDALRKALSAYRIISVEEACDKMETQYQHIKQQIHDAFDTGDVDAL